LESPAVMKKSISSFYLTYLSAWWGTKKPDWTVNVLAQSFPCQYRYSFSYQRRHKTKKLKESFKSHALTMSAPQHWQTLAFHNRAPKLH
jgi:hypothetical protein